jgi:hypothetical protein
MVISYTLIYVLDIDVNGLFEVERISKDTIHIKTTSVLDADTFWDR